MRQHCTLRVLESQTASPFARVLRTALEGAMKNGREELEDELERRRLVESLRFDSLPLSELFKCIRERHFGERGGLWPALRRRRIAEVGLPLLALMKEVEDQETLRECMIALSAMGARRLSIELVLSASAQQLKELLPQLEDEVSGLVEPY